MSDLLVVIIFIWLMLLTGLSIYIYLMQRIDYKYYTARLESLVTYIEALNTSNINYTTSMAELNHEHTTKSIDALIKVLERMNE